MSTNYRLVILMGPPAVGKGTLASKVVSKLDFLAISTGQVLREQISDKTDLGLSIKQIIDKGGLVSDTLINTLVSTWFYTHYNDNLKIMLDGYPRTLAQAVYLVELLQNKKILAESVVYVLEAAIEVVKQRMLGRIICPNKKCGKIYSKKFISHSVCEVCGVLLDKRADDTLDVVSARLDEYFRVKQEIIDYFISNGLKIIILETSVKTEEEVFADFKINVYDEKVRN